MSDGKKKPSGAEFRKRTREKDKILQEQLSRTPKLDQFFQKSQNNLVKMNCFFMILHKFLVYYYY